MRLYLSSTKEMSATSHCRFTELSHVGRRNMITTTGMNYLPTYHHPTIMERTYIHLVGYTFSYTAVLFG